MKAIIFRLSQLWQNDIFKFILIVLIFALIALLVVLARKIIAGVKRRKSSAKTGGEKFQIVNDIMSMDSDHIIE